MAFFQFIDVASTVSGLEASAESKVVTTTDSTEFLRKVRLSAFSLTAGEYRVVWTYMWNLASTALNFESRVRLNDSIILGEHVEEPTHSTGNFENTGSSQKLSHSGSTTRTLSGDVNIDLDWKSPMVGVAASIWDVRLELWRIS